MTPTIVNSAQRTGVKRTALVVDDVEDMLDLLEIALHSAHFSVLRASSAADARQLFESRANDIDLLMTDVRVGADSGLDLARGLRVSKPSLQVLAISGFAPDRKLTAKNNIEFLAKPFSTSELKTKLQAIFPSEPPRLTVTVSGDSRGHYTVSTTCRPARQN